MTSHRDSIRVKLNSGQYEEHKNLSICKINDFYRIGSGKIKYQVHCDNRSNFSQLYDDMEEAIDQYFELRRKIR